MANYVPTMKKFYNETVAPEMMKEFNYKSFMQVPRIEKVILSVGCGEAVQDKKLLESALNELELITGQKAVKTKARKSIANFKIREGQEIGAKVTLRGNIMWEFLDRLIGVALPRVKDFHGVKANAFDGHGNFSLGIQEQIIFPEIDYDKIARKPIWKPRHCCKKSVCRCGRRELKNGEKIDDYQGAAHAEVFDPKSQSMSSLRTTERIYSQIQNVQGLFSKVGE